MMDVDRNHFWQQRGYVAWLLAAGIVLCALCLKSITVADDAVASNDPIEHFDREVAPILLRHCLDCHSGGDPKGGLDLTTRGTMLSGGDSGPAVVPGSLEESLLWSYVNDGIMPPREEADDPSPLTESDLTALRTWIESGADWSNEPLDLFRFTTSKRAGYDWWSLQPLQEVSPPDVSSTTHADWVRNPVDAFVLAKLKEQGLTPSAEADRRTLIRRLTFNLIGLPPTPQEVEAFVADDDSAAYENLVERLLASPHYGERWARHWLDVARFGESQGFERDKLRENAWQYRDWVIRAFNDDLPYDEFVKMQLAGDVLAPDTADGIIATGFLVAGPWDEVGQTQQSELMRRVVRQDELEDYISTVSQAFLGLTVHCARCHDHKFDPISQQEYYQLAAALGGVHHGERAILTSDMQAEIARLQEEVEVLAAQLESIEGPVRDAILAERANGQDMQASPTPYVRWSFDEGAIDEILGIPGQLQGEATIENGFLALDGSTAYFASDPLPNSLGPKTLEAWVVLDDLEQQGGAAISIQSLDGETFDAIVYGEREPRRWMAGSNGFVRTQSFGGSEETLGAGDAESLVHVAIVYGADGGITGYRNGEPYGVPYVSDGPIIFPRDDSQVIVGLRHGVEAASGRMLAGRIDRVQLYDRALTAEEVRASAARADFVSMTDLLARMTEDQRDTRRQIIDRQLAVDERLSELNNVLVYAVSPDQPDATHRLHRGNSEDPREEVVAQGLKCLSTTDWEFALPADAQEADRRARLAEWIASAHNPLTPRVIVNRVWMHHFGAGLVHSPSDFGFNGGEPTHPELLDFLARQFIEDDWSLKALHRMIVTSATYRQQSLPRDECQAIDASNQWLWRFAPERIEAEVLRDTLLSVSGELNSQVGGAPFRDFETFTFNSQFYEMLDPIGPEFQRRTIYRTWVRSARSPFLDVFDCPDPSTTSPRRAVTTTPLQALSLLNNSFVLRMADRFASRVETIAGNSPPAQIEQVYRLAYQRTPTEQEARLMQTFVVEHGLQALCRVVLNSNEFLIIE